MQGTSSSTAPQDVEGAFVTLASRLQEVLDAPWPSELVRTRSGELLVRLGVDGTSKWHQGIEVCPQHLHNCRYLR